MKINLLIQIPAWLIVFSDILEWVSQLSILIPMVVAVKRKATFSRPVQLLYWYTYLSLFSSLGNQIGRYVFAMNMPVQHLYTLLKTLLFGWLYYLVIERPIHRQLIFWSVMAFVVFAFADAFWLEGITKYNSYSRAVQSIVLIAFSLLYFEQLLSSMRISRLREDPVYLVTTGLILYSAGTVMLFAINDRLNNDLTTLTLAYNIVFVLNIVFNVFLTLAFSRAKPSEDSPPRPTFSY